MVPPNPNAILNGLLESSRWGIVARDSAGLVQVWNRGAERILGWSEQEILGQPAPAALQLLNQSENEVEISLPRKDGEVIDVEVWTGTGIEGGMIAIISEVGRYRAVERK